MISLKTDLKTNDLCLNDQGDIAICSEDERIVQDVGSALSTWVGEISFNPLLGIDYDRFFLSNQNEINAFIFQLEKMAKTVNGVKSAKISINTTNKSRILNGKIKIIKSNNEVIYASF